MLEEYDLKIMMSEGIRFLSKEACNINQLISTVCFLGDQVENKYSNTYAGNLLIKNIKEMSLNFKTFYNKIYDVGESFDKFITERKRNSGIEDLFYDSQRDELESNYSNNSIFIKLEDSSAKITEKEKKINLKIKNKINKKRQSYNGKSKTNKTNKK